MMPQMRKAWACHDLPTAKEPGHLLTVPGTRYEFDKCPAGYLRTAAMGLPAPFLIDGTTHPATLVGEWSAEMETGAIRADEMPPRGRELVHLMRREKTEKHDSERDKRKG